jgi:hypothetical protein
MGQTKDVFIRMREDEFSQIPPEVKERFFNSKNMSVELNDFDENMKDETFSRLYREKKIISKQLDERTYQLRENRRKN